MVLSLLVTFAVQAEELTGQAQGFGGTVNVTVTKDEDKITDVKVLGENETAGVGTKAIDELPAKIVEANSADVYAVAGAAITSEAIIGATKIALGQKDATQKEPENKEVSESNLDGASIGLAFMASPRIQKAKNEGEKSTYYISQLLMAAIFDKDGKIIYNYADAFEVASPNGPEYNQKLTSWPGQKGVVDAEGKEITQDEEAFLAEIKSWVTKRSLGENYKMPAGSWQAQMNRFQELFNGKTIEEVEEWVNKYTSDASHHPLSEALKDEEDVKKFNALSDKEKAMLADVTSSATMSLNSASGDFVGALKRAYANRVPLKKLENASFGFGLTTSGRVGPGKDDKETQIYSLNEVLAAVLFDSDGKIIDSHIDQLEVASPNAHESTMPRFSGYPGYEPYSTDVDYDGKVDEDVPAITDESFSAEIENWNTKRERGENYKLKSGTWASEMNAYEEFFVGKTVAELEDWFGKYTASNGRPLKPEQKKEEDQKKYDALSDEEKAMLADVTSSATISLNDSHGDIIGAIKNAYENRVEANITLDK